MNLVFNVNLRSNDRPYIVAAEIKTDSKSINPAIELVSVNPKKGNKIIDRDIYYFLSEKNIKKIVNEVYNFLEEEI